MLSRHRAIPGGCTPHPPQLREYDGAHLISGGRIRSSHPVREQGTLPDSQISSAWRGVTFSSPNVAHAAGESAAAPRGPRPLALRAGEGRPRPVRHLRGEKGGLPLAGGAGEGL